jgi:parallel beta-helix repeat protein
MGGGAASGQYFTGSFINCLVTGNEAMDYGGGIYCNYQSAATLVNCTVSDNAALLGGGGLWVDDMDADAFAVNSIVWGNHPIENPRARFAWSDVEGGSAGIGVIAATPEFVHPWDGVLGDYHLLPGSPCIDSGSNEAAAEIPLDMDGNVRIWDGDDVPGAVVDMGAYEFGSELPPVPGDTDGNGVVNGLDLFFFSQWWQQAENETNFRCDCVDDEVIDEYDLHRLMMDW